MNVTVEIPDELGSEMSAAGADLPRRVRETIALEEYKAGRISKAQFAPGARIRDPFRARRFPEGPRCPGTSSNGCN
jgi:hypothetical protein